MINHTMCHLSSWLHVYTNMCYHFVLNGLRPTTTILNHLYHSTHH